MLGSAQTRQGSALHPPPFEKGGRKLFIYFLLRGIKPMALYAIGDLHLGLSADKPMDVFGPGWANHTERLRETFSALGEEDVTVLCGDTSWGMDLPGSLADFRFVDALPGRKLLLKGNHDYFWNTAAKMERFFAENGITTIGILHNNCHFYGDYALCGTRGWFAPEEAHSEKMLRREALRLEASLKLAEGRPILAFLHYPPLYEGYRCPEILEKLTEYGVERCFYGHLHGAAHRRAVQGEVDGVEYSLVSADYLRFVPKKICD